MRKQIWRSAVLLMVLAASLAAESSNAVFSGSVTDPRGAVVVGATVTIQNKSTNVVETTKCNSAGLHSLTGLIPGSYTLKASHSGFKGFEQRDILLQVGDHVALDIRLRLGSTSESVTVTAEAAPDPGWRRK